VEIENVNVGLDQGGFAFAKENARGNHPQF